MFRITEDPSSGSLVQCLAKITRIILSWPLTWTWSVRVYSSLNYTRAQRVKICCHNTDHVHVNRHDRTILIILTKHCMKLPDDGSSVIRKVVGHFLNIL